MTKSQQHRSPPSTKTANHSGSSSIRRLRVDHTYRDFSRYFEKGGKVVEHKKCGRNFPAKLHAILSEPGYSHIITWMPHGRTFRILDKALLMTHVVPTFFGQTKFESFTRQLSGWGYKRLHRPGPDYGCYYQELFLRDMPRLTWLMRRAAKSQGKATPFADGEPDFALISETYPLPPLGTTTAASALSSAMALPATQPESELLTPSSVQLYLQSGALAGTTTIEMLPSHGHGASPWTYGNASARVPPLSSTANSAMEASTASSEQATGVSTFSMGVGGLVARQPYGTSALMNYPTSTSSHSMSSRQESSPHHPSQYSPFAYQHDSMNQFSAFHPMNYAANSDGSLGGSYVAHGPAVHQPVQSQPAEGVNPSSKSRTSSTQGASSEKEDCGDGNEASQGDNETRDSFTDDFTAFINNYKF